MALFVPLFQALNASGGRYVVVGGVATVLHGHARLTADVDVIVEFEREGLTRLLDAVTELGLRPRPPVAAKDFADPACRAAWIRDKGMRVFSFWDPNSPMRELDLFVEHPIDFEELWSRSVLVEIGGTEARIASIGDLIALKRLAGRPQDLQDIQVLESIAKRHGKA
ncbi:MAG: hypothetical protein KF718_29105 [Polyangiaceae bacterium]|nr:hypothetical protein [Polyangiaceae bacterium]